MILTTIKLSVVCVVLGIGWKTYRWWNTPLRKRMRAEYISKGKEIEEQIRRIETRLRKSNSIEYLTEYSFYLYHHFTEQGYKCTILLAAIRIEYE